MTWDEEEGLQLRLCMYKVVEVLRHANFPDFETSTEASTSDIELLSACFCYDCIEGAMLVYSLRAFADNLPTS